MEAAKDHTQIMKGKRTRRRNRAHSPILSSSVSTTHCSNESNTFGAVLSEEEDEDEDQLNDMANCLILLARGHNSKNPPTKPQKIPNRDQSRASETKPMVGFHNQVYQCKTCDRTFPSFQALGGHRASHNKVKPATIDQTVGLQESDQEEVKNNLSSSSSSPPNLSLQSLFLPPPPTTTAKKPMGLSNKVHECSICGAEFMSGQALGGHMRRHRVTSTGTTMAVVGNSTTTTTSLCLSNHQIGFRQSRNQEEEEDEDGDEQLHLAKKSRIVMSLDLDLNLPAPEDGGGGGGHLHHHLNFQSKQQETPPPPPPLVLHNLVGCHY